MKPCTLVSAIGLAASSSLDAQYVSYLGQWGKSYATREEYEMRKSVFVERDKFINEWNSRGETHTLGHN